ncbi:hypothetical protein BJV82DRAFT_39643 [Fennellomyces sp. T-0311]|nr:hypothetical protein BJV82DRAFT_39643 [Fennellomyces sp. T-0311]
MTYQRAQQPQQQQEPELASSGQYQRLELKPAMDLCNIYIKHIDRSLKSAELYNLFERFGRIISARVMEDPATGTSRGFGFVSYSHPTEAAAALLEMNGYDSSADSDKPSTGELMSVRFHEPRVPRPERDHQQQVIKLLQSPLAGHFSFEHVLPINDTSIPETETSGGLVGHAPPPPPLIMPQSSMFYPPYSPSPTQTSQPVSPFTMHHNYHHQNSPIFPHSPYMIPHSPRSGNSPYFYYYAQQQPVMHEYYSPQMMHQIQQQPRPPYTARQQQQLVDTKKTEYLEENKDELTGQDEDEESLGSGTSESASKRAEAITRTSSPPDGGHQRLLEAVQQKLPQGDEAKINMIVDRLMATLTRKERSLCLFNEEYLERQIRQALEWQ